MATTTPYNDSPVLRAAYLRSLRRGFAGRPGISPGQPINFGAITGGLAGPLIICGDQGHLRAALAAPGPAWILVRPSAGGRLRGDLEIRTDNKTIIAPEGVTFTGGGLRVREAVNVAVVGLTFDAPEEDGIGLRRCRVVSIMGCTVRRWGDGALDSTDGSSDVSVLGCLFEDGAKGILVEANDAPFRQDYSGGPRPYLGMVDSRYARVSFIGCRTRRVKVRHPLVRHGLVTLEDHHVEDPGKQAAVEARTNARVMWLSGSYRGPGIAATYRGQDAKVHGRMYVAPQVDLGGARADVNWTPSAAEMRGAQP